MFSFTWAGHTTNGYNPSGGLVLARDGCFYGVTVSGGPGGDGTVFKITTNGALTTLGSFGGNTGAVYPIGRLLQAADGSFYGAAGGGSFDSVIFRMTPAHVLTALTYFGERSDSGADPVGGLVQGADGNLYGWTLRRRMEWGVQQ